jgi:hypothetical protein
LAREKARKIAVIFAFGRARSGKNQSVPNKGGFRPYFSPSFVITFFCSFNSNIST